MVIWIHPWSYMIIRVYFCFSLLETRLHLDDVKILIWIIPSLNHLRNHHSKQTVFTLGQLDQILQPSHVLSNLFLGWRLGDKLFIFPAQKLVANSKNDANLLHASWSIDKRKWRIQATKVGAQLGRPSQELILPLGKGPGRVTSW